MINIRPDSVNRLLSYILFPIRCCLIGSIVGLGSTVWFLSTIYYPTYSFPIQLYVTDSILFYTGITIKIPNDMGWLGYGNLHNTTKFITVFNHSHPLDLPVLLSSMRRPLTGVVNRVYVTNMVSRALCRRLGLVVCEKRRCATPQMTGIIQNYFQTNTSQCLVLSPVSGEQVHYPQVFPAFNVSVFSYQRMVLPIVISYVASQTNQFIGPHNLTKPSNIIKMLLQCILDGHIVVHVNFILLQHCTDNPIDYRDNVYEVMSKQFLELPQKTPTRIICPPKISFRWDGFWLVMILLCSPVSSFYFSRAIIAISTTTWLTAKYPSNNSALIYHVAYRMIQFQCLVSWTTVFYHGLCYIMGIVGLK